MAQHTHILEYDNESRFLQGLPRERGYERFLLALTKCTLAGIKRARIVAKQTPVRKSGQYRLNPDMSFSRVYAETNQQYTQCIAVFDGGDQVASMNFQEVGTKLMICFTGSINGRLLVSASYLLAKRMAKSAETHDSVHEEVSQVICFYCESEKIDGVKTVSITSKDYDIDAD
ncbi:MAG: hypothetical protein RLZZ324_989 [Candidatus Parcubacteria bacterium]